MLRSQTMHLSNAKYMNDQLEYQTGDPEIWKNLFFSCFMMEEDESIGMWSMYAQPWRDGVKISIPKDILRRWVKETKEIIELEKDKLPKDIKDGSIIIYENNEYKLDLDEEELRRKRIQDRFNRLRKKDV